MSFRLLNISSMYPGYLESFHNKHPQIASLSYIEHQALLLNDTTEFAGSYYRNFKRLGIEADCIITNYTSLQNKWRSENGVISRDTQKIIFEQVKSYNPDVLWVEDLNHINSSWLEHIRTEIKRIKLIVAYHCAGFNRSVIEKLRGFDFVITCTPGIKQSFESEGIRSYLVYHGFDKDALLRLENHSNTQKHNLVFSGSLFPGANLHNDRIDFIEGLLQENADLTLYVNLEKQYKIKIKQSIYFLSTLMNKLRLKGVIDKIPVFDYARSPVRNYSGRLLSSNHKSVFGIEMYNLFNSSNIVLNMHVDVAGNYAGNMRLFEVTGIGSCLLTDNKKNIGDLFDINTEIVVYNSVEDCVEKAKWLIEHNDEREKIAVCGQQKTLKLHTIEDRCRTIIDIIDRELKQL
jgi:spore maturation protein CgeB